MHYESGGKQEWRHEDLGYNSAYKTITCSIFEFGFTDAMLQMRASFIEEYVTRESNKTLGCVTPYETYKHHVILTAALESGKTGKSFGVNYT